MKKDPEFSKSKLGLAIIAFFGIAIGAWLWISSQNLEAAIDHQAAENAHDYTQSPYIGVEDECPMISSAEIDKCIFEKQERAREGRRKEYDLQAQQKAALWSRTTGRATIIAMAVGFFGIGLVFYTFWEARRAANAGFEANRIAQNAQRPWLIVNAIKMNEDGSISVCFKNIGKTPATNFLKDGDSVAMPPVFYASPIPELDDTNGTTVFPGQTEFMKINNAGSDLPVGYELYVRIFGSYQLPSGDIDRITEGYALTTTKGARKVTGRDFIPLEDRKKAE
ncbi:hypothetical protein [Parasphingorhabdus sp. NYA22]